MGDRIRRKEETEEEEEGEEEEATSGDARCAHGHARGLFADMKSRGGGGGPRVGRDWATQ